MSDSNLDPAQAAELALLVELEARWENLRSSPPRSAEVRCTVQDLQSKQKAYETFRTKLAAYNKRYRQPHAPELLLNTPLRLGTWCRRMRDLYAQVGSAAEGLCPVDLVEKAHRWAAKVAARLGKDRLTRPEPPANLQAAVGDLEALCRWCDDLAGPRPLSADAGGPPRALPA